MTKYSNRAVTYAVWIIEGSDNRDSDNRGPTVAGRQVDDM